MNLRIVSIFGAFSLLVACDPDTGAESSNADRPPVQVPAHFPEPRLPEENIPTTASVELGRRLFYDTRLSLNQTQSCASCHLQEFAFTDGLGQAIGSTGEVHPRGAMSMVNMAYTPRFTWANSILDRLSAQARLPLFGDTPVELGFAGREDELVARLEAVPEYVDLFSAAYPGRVPVVSVNSIVDALEAFQLTIISGNSPYDRYLQGDTDALDDSQLRGMGMFFSERLECFHCHGGLNFSDSLTHTGLAAAEVAFHNTGLYNIDGDGGYPPSGRGLYEVSNDVRDMGRFRAPTLRNIEVTAPDMHDGSALTLSDVIDHYAAGGRTIVDGPFAGVGAESPFKNPFVSGFLISDSERADLIAFLNALTDETLLTDPRFSDPFETE